MTLIEVYVNKGGSHYTGFHVNGHAKYAENGKDIVCAAVSALTITLQNSIQILTDAEVHTVRYICDENERIYIMDPNEKTDLLIASYCIGIESIAEEYPDYVKLHLET